MNIKFTKPVVLSSNNRRDLDGTENQIVKGVFALSANSIETDEILTRKGPIMSGYDIVKIDADGIDFDIIFNNPVAVSTDDLPDLLIVWLDLSSYEDSSGNKLPQAIIKYIDIPTQIADEDEAKRVIQAGDDGSSMTKGGLSAKLLLSVLLAGGMEEVWSILNSL